jgi:WD40 repeat protein
METTWSLSPPTQKSRYSLIHTQIWNLQKGTLAYSLYGHSGDIKTSAFSSQGDFFATGGIDGTLLIWKSGFSKEKG